MEKNSEFDSYAIVYDKKYGYYDEKQYYIATEEAIKMQDSMSPMELKIHMQLYRKQHWMVIMILMLKNYLYKAKNVLQII